MIALSHSLRALAAWSAAILLACAPLAAPAAEQAVPPAALPAPAADSVAGNPAAAVIHVGDQLAIAVYGDASLTQTTVVQPDGTIQYPLVGKIALAGKTTTQARDLLTAQLEHYVKHPLVTIGVTQGGQMNVLVMGNVKNPGKFQIRSGAHLTEAIAAAAGVASMNGDFPTVRVLEGDGSLQTASLQKLLREGDATQNVALSDNATIYVTGAETIRVQVLGAVTRPGNVEVNIGDRLSMALARAGAEAQAKPDLNRVYLTRKDPATGQNRSYQFDMYQALQHGDQRFDPVLQKDDTVYIPEARTVSPATIGVLGILGRLIGL